MSDFLQAHFALAPRNDTEFWRANKELKLSDQIQEKIAMYRAGLPVNAPTAGESEYYGNFDAEFRNFWTNGSYYCIFSGLGLQPEHPLPALLHRTESLEGPGRSSRGSRRSSADCSRRCRRTTTI
ncbi:tryptophan 7-halogenase [Streptomyces sp. NBC_01381]|uniref:tryptophan 7-halogenase n=1 Tax=Streptomyces sp. NBC_01381 TaxID=2903845 RepID=UPI00224E9DE9|nr:tryptophan 7-halogenase [Streptomyces sp. NBC_01381]MCX4671920.1 tryptophan 7-halogenase [Streptomyces sp. NBC_01381]